MKLTVVRVGAPRPNPAAKRLVMSTGASESIVPVVALSE